MKKSREKDSSEKKLRGRNPTVNESKILSNNNLNSNNWLIHKIKLVPINRVPGPGGLTKDQSKIPEWTLVHRENGMSKKIYIGGE